MEAHGIEVEPGKAVDAGAEADESRLGHGMRSHSMRNRHLGWLLLTVWVGMAAGDGARR